MHWSEEVCFQTHDNDLLEELITHQKLLAGSGDVSVSVLESHSGKSGLLGLNRNVSGQINSDLGFLGRMHSWVGGSSPNVEALIANLIHHDYLII